jgi:hypothetical protein
MDEMLLNEQDDEVNTEQYQNRESLFDNLLTNPNFTNEV